MGLVQIRRFSGNSTDDERALTVQGSQGGTATAVLGAAEEGVAEHFQPMRVRLPGQELRRGLTLAVGAIAALQPAVVQVKLEQGQIVRAQVAAKEKVTSQATIEVLHQGTGADCLLGHRGDRKLNRMEPTPQLFAQGRFLGPTPGVTLVTRLRFEHASCEFGGNLQLLS